MHSYKAALPHDWIINEKSLATAGAIPNAKVMTGKATAPPPSEVIPATVAPKIIVILSTYLSGKRLKRSCLKAKHHQQNWKKKKGMRTPINLRYLTKSLSVQGADSSKLAKAWAWVWFNFWPSRKYFLQKFLNLSTNREFSSFKNQKTFKDWKIRYWYFSIFVNEFLTFLAKEIQAEIFQKLGIFRKIE